MESEGLQFEEKSQFDWLYGQPHALAKTIVAFANTQGGKLRLSSVLCEKARLDSARLCDFVNKSVSPAITDVSVEFTEDGACIISVEPSKSAPHIFTKNASYKDQEGVDRTAWHAGQFYARHSSKSEPAGSDDIARCIQAHVAEWLSKLGSAMQSLSLDIKGDKSSLPVSISDGPAALKIGVADPNTDYPFLTKKVGSMLKRDQNWTAMASERLGLKDDPTYSLSIKGGKGQIVMRRYNERAVEKLKAHLEAVPDFDPYHG